MKVKPLHDRVIVKRTESEEKTKGGIISIEKFDIYGLYSRPSSQSHPEFDCSILLMPKHSCSFSNS